VDAHTFAITVNCVIMQNTGAGLHASISEHCDGVNDGAYGHTDTSAISAGSHMSPFGVAGVCVVKWPTEKGKDQIAMCAIVTVFGIAYFV
jgi:hypothetical protein